MRFINLEEVLFAAANPRLVAMIKRIQKSETPGEAFEAYSEYMKYSSKTKIEHTYADMRFVIEFGHDKNNESFLINVSAEHLYKSFEFNTTLKGDREGIDAAFRLIYTMATLNK